MNRKTNSVGALLLGSIGSSLILKAGYETKAAGLYLAGLRSVSENTVAEHFYQGIGHYIQNFLWGLYGLGMVCMAITIAAAVAIWPPKPKSQS